MSLPADPAERHRVVAGRFTELARGTTEWDAPSPVRAELLGGLEPIEELMRGSGQYGPRMPVPDDAPVQDRLLGFIGRDPSWRP